MRDLVQLQRSFAFETTCAGKSYLRMLEQCKQSGWSIRLLYFWLPSPDYSRTRVARRVKEGGHNIPTDVIYRRYSVGIANMRRLYLPVADEAEIYDNRDRERILIARKRYGQAVEITDSLRWAAIEEAGR